MKTTKINFMLIMAVMLSCIISCKDEGKDEKCNLEESWYYYDDSANNGNSVILVDGTPPEKDETGAWIFQFKTIDINGEPTKVSVLTGTLNNGYQYPFIGMGIRLAPENDLHSCPDFGDSIRNAQGVKFKCKGNNLKYAIQLEIDEVKDWNWHGFPFNATDSIQEIIVLYNDTNLAQENWGTPVTFNKEGILRISFTIKATLNPTIPIPLDAGLQIWDLEPIE